MHPVKAENPKRDGSRGSRWVPDDEILPGRWSSNKNEVKKNHGGETSQQTNMFFFFLGGGDVQKHASKHVGFFWEHRGETVWISFTELDKVWESRILRKTTNKNWVVVSKIFYFHPYLGKISNLANIFEMV